MKVLNDLYDYNLKIYQDSEKFKFSLDSLLLAEFVEIKQKDIKIIDFCSGNAPLPLILASKYNKNIIGVEIQEDIYNLAKESIEYNHLEDKITMLNINVKDTNNYFPGNNFDIVTCNPPFFKVEKTSLLNPRQELAIARHEITITLEEIIRSSSILLKNGGKLYIVHRPERLQEMLDYATKNNLYAKEIKFITSKPNEYAIMVLIKFVKNGNIGTKISTSIINRDTKTYKNIFNN